MYSFDDFKISWISVYNQYIPIIEKDELYCEKVYLLYKYFNNITDAYSIFNEHIDINKSGTHRYIDTYMKCLDFDVDLEECIFALRIFLLYAYEVYFADHKC